MRLAKTAFGVCLLALAIASLVFGQERTAKEDPLTGTWDCVAHLSGEDDTPFTLKLVQKGETVTGSVVAGDAEMEISAGTFKNNVLEIHCETPEAKYQAAGKLDGDQLKGHWSKAGDGIEGDWEGKRQIPSKSTGR